MSRKYHLLISGLLLLLSMACQTGNEKLNEQISALESELMAPGLALDTSKADKLVKKYELFVAQYPNDSLSPHYLRKAAEVLMNTGNPTRSIAMFEKVVREYPQYKRVPECLFMIAFVYETSLNDIVKARDAYLLFLKKYPTHQFADDAQAMLNNLGKSPEELIREFETKSQGSN